MPYLSTPGSSQTCRPLLSEALLPLLLPSGVLLRDGLRSSQGKQKSVGAQASHREPSPLFLRKVATYYTSLIDTAR